MVNPNTLTMTCFTQTRTKTSLDVLVLVCSQTTDPQLSSGSVKEVAWPAGTILSTSAQAGQSFGWLYVHGAQGKARGAETKLYNLSSSLYGSLVSADMVGLPSHVGVRDHISDQRWRSAGVLMEYMHDIMKIPCCALVTEPYKSQVYLLRKVECQGLAALSMQKEKLAIKHMQTYIKATRSVGPVEWTPYNLRASGRLHIINLCISVYVYI